MVAPHDADDRGVLALEPGRLRRVEQGRQLRSGEELVRKRVERGLHVASGVPAAYGHHRLAVPAQERPGRVQVGEHRQARAQLVSR